MRLFNAKAICYQCGSNNERSDTGYCENDHDDWIEISETERIIKASKKFKVGVQKIIEIIHNKSVLDSPKTLKIKKMKNKNNIVGKKAVIDCLTEQLKQIGIPSDCKHIYPGKEVKIFQYDDEHSKFGSVYKVDDLSGCPSDFFYSIPLIWLNIKE